MELMSVLLNMDGIVDLGMAETIIERCTFHEPDLSMVINGKDEIARALLPDLMGNIVYHARVTAVTQAAEGMEVE